MTMLSGIGLLKGIMSKMDWLDQNQRVLSQNIANADTPGYQPMSLKPADFESVLGASAKSGAGTAPQLKMTPVTLEASNSMHFGTQPGTKTPAAEKAQRTVYEASPDNNGVVIEEQLFKANRNQMDYQLATNLYRRNVGMLRMALGERG